MLEELFCITWAAFEANWTKINVSDKAETRRSVAAISAKVVRTLFYTEKDIAIIRKHALEEMTKPNAGDSLVEVTYQAARALSGSSNNVAAPTPASAPASPPKAGNGSGAPVTPVGTVSARLRRITILAANRPASEPTTPTGEPRNIKNLKKGPPSSSSTADLRQRSSTERDPSDKTNRAYRKTDKLPKVMRSATESPRFGTASESESESTGM